MVARVGNELFISKAERWDRNYVNRIHYRISTKSSITEFSISTERLVPHLNTIEMILQPIYPQVMFEGENSCQKMMMQNKHSIIRSVRGTILHNSRGIIPKFIGNNPSRRLLIMITASQSSSPVRFINKVTGESCAFVSKRKLYLVATRLAHFTHVCQISPTKNS